MGTWVMRLGHRPARDERLSTHLCLTARALGAQGVMLSTSDLELARRVNDVTARFGGDFQVLTGVKAPTELKRWPGKVLHLTMYGRSLSAVTPTLRRWVRHGEPLLIVVGATKVPAYVYQRADLNLAVGHQPHSEVAALALVLDRLHSNWEGEDPVGPVTVTDAPSGKKVGRVPTPAECLSQLQADRVPARVVEHSQAVAELALDITRRIPGARQGLVEAGSLLHDWGRCLSPGLDHGFHGGQLARKAGFSPDLAHMITTHLGAGVTCREASTLGLPRGDYLPRTLEARIVAGADNLLTGTRRRPIDRCIKALEREGHTAGARRVERLHHRLCRLAHTDIERL